MEILIISGIFAGILSLVVWQYNHVIKSLMSDNKDLLNRLMAKNYNEYATFEHVKGVAEVESMAKKIMERDQDVFQVD
jgi:hypothetical protein